MNTIETPATFEFAQRKLTYGTHAFGMNEIASVCGGQIMDSLPLRFTPAEIDRAVGLGQYLIYQSDKAADGSPLTMKSIHDRLGNKLGDGEDKLLYSVDWYKDEKFYLNDTPRKGWRLVTKDVIPGSTSQNYVQQTRTLSDYLVNRVYGGENLPNIYQKAVDEFRERESELARMIDKDWKKGAKECADLKINLLCRETPVEVLKGIAVYRTVNGSYPLQGMYAWTSVLSSDGYLVLVGRCAPSGVCVDSGGPGRSLSGLGVRFSRSAVPDLES